MVVRYSKRVLEERSMLVSTAATPTETERRVELTGYALVRDQGIVLKERKRCELSASPPVPLRNDAKDIQSAVVRNAQSLSDMDPAHRARTLDDEVGALTGLPGGNEQVVDPLAELRGIDRLRVSIVEGSRDRKKTVG